RSSHATFMRRVAEYLGPDHIMEVGIRAFSKAELDFCKKEGVAIVTPLDLRRDGIDKTGRRVSSFLGRFRHAYVTVDIDVLDPAFAPGVGNPEPDGLSTDELLSLVGSSMVRNLSGFDLVEVSPQLDSGQTAAVGAKVILEAVAAHHSRSHSR
ncbi:MAG TPA: arginase family protein, partial [Candidatus Bathyarchaeia archaeon]